MSIVGPRPVASDQINLFRFGKYNDAKKVKPGITGPAALYDYIYGDQFEEASCRQVQNVRQDKDLLYQIWKC